MQRFWHTAFVEVHLTELTIIIGWTLRSLKYQSKDGNELDSTG